MNLLPIQYEISASAALTLCHCSLYPCYCMNLLPLQHSPSAVAASMPLQHQRHCSMKLLQVWLLQDAWLLQCLSFQSCFARNHALTASLPSADHVHVFDPSSKQWSKHAVSNSSRLVLCRHTATALQNNQSIILLGGGMNCFGFGTTFSPAVLLDISSLIKQHTALQPAAARTDTDLINRHQQQAVDNGPAAEASSSAKLDPPAGFLPLPKSSPSSYSVDQPLSQSRALSNVPQAAASSAAVPHSLIAGDESSQGLTHPQGLACNGHVASHMPGKQGLAVARLQAKVAKDALRSLGWLDQSCKAQADTQHDQICLPLTDQGSTMLQSLQVPSCNGNLDQPADDSLSVATPGVQELQTDRQPCTANVDNSGSQPASTPQDSCSKGSEPKMKGKAAEAMGKAAVSKGKAAESKGKAAAGKGSQEEGLACLVALIQCGLAEVKTLQVQRVARHEGRPAQRLKTAVTSILQQQVGLCNHMRLFSGSTFVHRLLIVSG